MKTYIIKRLAAAFVTLWVLLTLNFIIFRVAAPVKDPAVLIFDPYMTIEEKEALRKLWNLDAPLFPDQYVNYLINLLTWQYGFSLETSGRHKPIAPEMAWRLRNTAIMLGLALIVQVAIGIPLGIIAGSRRGSKTDASIIGFNLFTWGFPTFFIQMIMLFYLCYQLHYRFGWSPFPTTGIVSFSTPEQPLLFIADVLWHSIIPVASLAIAGIGSWALYSRNMMVETLTDDYIRTARAIGVSNRDVLYKHAFRAILPPVVTILAMSIPGIVTGAMITEHIFSWPGIGQWYLEAINTNNFPVTQAVLYNYGVLMILANLAADLLYGVLDPRVRFGVRR